MNGIEVIEYTDDEFPESTSIERVVYNRNTLRMTVKFVLGGLYSYDHVTPGLYENFIQAPSLGLFFRNVFRQPGDPWPGAKHDEHQVRFEKVEVETAALVEEPNLDALKVNLLTSGEDATHGMREFDITFSYTGRGKVAVQARDHEEAIRVLETYFQNKGIKITPEGVFIPL